MKIRIEFNFYNAFTYKIKLFFFFNILRLKPLFVYYSLVKLLDWMSSNKCRNILASDSSHKMAQ